MVKIAQDLRNALDLVAKLDPTNPPIISFRANDICSMGIARSASAVNRETIWLYYTWANAASWFSEDSRHWNHHYRLRNPAENPNETVRQLVTLGEALLSTFGRPLLVLPSSDTVQTFLFQNEATLSPYFNIYGDMNYRSFRRDITNKGIFFENLANSLHSVCPKTLYFTDQQSLQNAAHAAKYPSVLKPAIKDTGQTFYKFNKRRKAVLANSPLELVQQAEKFIRMNLPMVVQELIDFDPPYGEVPFYCFFDRNHRLQFSAAGVKRVIQPATYGTAIVLELTQNKDLIKISEKLGELLAWTGPLMIEFIHDRNDNSWKIIEINTRPWLFHDFYRQNGFPFIGAVILDHEDRFDPNGDLCSLLTQTKKPQNVPTTTEQKSRIHVDLPSFIKYLNARSNDKKLTSSDVLSALQNYDSVISYAHGNSDDPVPLERAITEISDAYNLSSATLIKFAMSDI